MGYIKRTPLAEYRTQNRGGVGSQGHVRHATTDFIEHIYRGHDAQHDALLHREGALLLVEGLPDSRRNALVEGTRHPERHPDRTGRQGARLHQRQAPRRRGVRQQQLYRDVYQGRYDQEDPFRGLFAAAQQRRQCHRHPRGRPAHRGQAHQRRGRGDDRGARGQGDPLQRADGASDRPCRAPACAASRSKRATKRSA